jgi:DNA-binding response OmpR family regulator
MKERVANHCEAERVPSPPAEKILLVDEDIRDLEYDFKLLEEQGHKVVTCPSYTLGARLLECGAFDLVVVSQGGLAFEGRPVLERAMQVTPHTPVLVLANCVDMGAYLEAMQLGAVDYLQKPVNPLEMVRAIRTYLPPAQGCVPGDEDSTTGEIIVQVRRNATDGMPQQPRAQKRAFPTATPFEPLRGSDADRNKRKARA